MSQPRIPSVKPYQKDPAQLVRHKKVSSSSSPPRLQQHFMWEGGGCEGTSVGELQPTRYRSIADLVWGRSIRRRCSSSKSCIFCPQEIDCCHRNSSQNTVQSYLARVRTLLCVCWIEFDTLKVGDRGYSSKKKKKKEWSGFYFSRHFFTFQLVGCWWFYFFPFGLWCAALRSPALMPVARCSGICSVPFGISSGKSTLLMLFVITVHRNHQTCNCGDMQSAIVEWQQADCKLNVTFS